MGGGLHNAGWPPGTLIGSASMDWDTFDRTSTQSNKSRRTWALRTRCRPSTFMRASGSPPRAPAGRGDWRQCSHQHDAARLCLARQVRGQPAPEGAGGRIGRREAENEEVAPNLVTHVLSRKGVSGARQHLGVLRTLYNGRHEVVPLEIYDDIPAALTQPPQLSGNYIDVWRLEAIGRGAFCEIDALRIDLPTAPLCIQSRSASGSCLNPRMVGYSAASQPPPTPTHTRRIEHEY